MASKGLEASVSTAHGATAVAVPGSRPATEFNAAIHGLRGVASILVLLAHIFGGTARHIYFNNLNYVRLVQHPWYFGTFGVEIFFVISGFVIVPSAMKYSLGEFALRRFVRIYPLFVTLSIVFIVLNCFTNDYPKLNDLRTILSGFTFLNLFTGTDQLTPNAWSLSFEIWFYVLTGLVVTFAIKRRSLAAGSVTITAALAFVVAFPISVYFLIGVVLRLVAPKDKPATVLTRIVGGTSLVLLLWFASRAHFDYTSWSQFTHPAVLPILASLFCFFMMALRKGSLMALAMATPLFRYAGDVSYSLYLVHPFVYFAVRMLFVRYQLFSDDVAISMGLFASVVVVASFVVTHGVHVILERGPYEAVFRQRVFRGEDEVAKPAPPC